MTVAVVVPARDAAATLPATLAGLAAQTVQADVVVVDDGSRDATVAVGEAAGVRVLRRGGGEGAGAARNAGVAATDAEVIAFTDADCVPSPGWLAAGLRALRDADLVQGRTLPDPGAPRHRFEHTLHIEAPTGLFEAANLFVTRDTFDRAGGFGRGIETGGRPFGEDVLFGWMARRAGARSAFAPDALVHHAVFAMTPGDFLRERWRLRWFPELLRTVPELRDGIFLSARTREFDAAALGVALALASRRPALALAAVPYLRRLPHPVRIAGDAIGAMALVSGSVRARTALL